MRVPRVVILLAGCLLVAGAAATAGAGALLREVWLYVGGTAVSDIPTNTPPDSTNWVTSLFEAPANVGDNYGQRISGLLMPPQSGLYTFWICSDDASELWLATNAAGAGRTRIARLTSSVLPGVWDAYSMQESAPVNLATGRCYSIEALMKEGTGLDFVAVRWQRPDGVIEEPIPAAYFCPPRPFSKPAIVSHPASLAIEEGGTATFSVTASNLYPSAFQWQRNASSLPGAMASNLVLTGVALTNDGAQFRCIVSNAVGSVTSAVAALTVTADGTCPAIEDALNLGTGTVRVVFSEAVGVATATNPINYQLSGGIAVHGAAFGADARTILLACAALTYGNGYTVTVSNVRDRAATPNTILPGSALSFTATEFALLDVGAPAIVGAAVQADGGFDMVAGGTGVGGLSDQFCFNYVQRTGDFDVVVRVAGLERADLLSQAGLMARESLAAASDFVAVLGTPSLGGVRLACRRTGEANLLLNGNFEAGKEWGDNPRYWYGWNLGYAETNGTVHEGGLGRPAPTPAHDGTWMVRVDNDPNNPSGHGRGTGQSFPMKPGESCVFSVWYLIQSNLLAKQFTRASLEWCGPSGAEVAYDTRVYGTAFSNQQATWAYTAVTGTAPAGTATAKAVITFTDDDGQTNTPAQRYNAYWDTASATLGAGGGVETIGFCPVNYPLLWLRLQRAGDVFTGYASADGQRWTIVHALSNAMPATVYVGMAAASRDASAVVTAEFRDWSEAVGGYVRGLGPVRCEPPGPSSRRTGLVISEIMYHPANRADGRDIQFVELFNSEAMDSDIGGFRLSGDADYTFLPGTVLPAGGFLVVAAEPADVAAVYGLSGVLGPYAGRLPNGSGTVRLRNAADAVLLEVEYEDDPPWPLAADGAGHSLVLARPSWGEGNAEAWSASALAGGSPGAWDPAWSDAYSPVVINEFLAHTDPPLCDFIELYNSGSATVDLTGCILSDDVDTNKFVMPAGTKIEPRAFLVSGTNALGFNLSSRGEEIYFRSPGNGRVIDCVRFEGQENGVSSGRYPDGGPGFFELAAVTVSNRNSGLKQRDVVINEIMYHPPFGDEAGEYVEIHNRSGSPVDVGGWRFRDGIEFTIPAGKVIAAGGHLVIAANATNLIAKHPGVLNSTNTIGNFSGQLADGGERLVLAKLDDPEDEDEAWVTMDEVTYGDDDLWGRWADGGGSSLELTDPDADNRLAANWAGSDESRKSAWTSVCVTGLLDHGMGSADEVHLLMLRAGECLVDQVNVRRFGSSNNRVTNESFEAGLNGWTMTGNHVQSGLEPTGYLSSASLHIRATGGGDTGPNRIESTLSSALPVNSNAVIQFQARWLCGHTDLLVRVRGNYHEAVGHLSRPANLGTPGAVNSRYCTNAGPAIYEVAHDPVLPAAGEPVIVSARAHDPDGIALMQLLYRMDPAAVTGTVTMALDGSGVYTGGIPAQAAGTLVAFHIQATDSNTPTAGLARFPSGAPARECLVRFGEAQPAGSLGVYRLWLTQTNVNTWSGRPPLSNEGLDGTLVYGNFRAIYNASARYRGSPFIRPGYNSPVGNLCAYLIEAPESDPLLGAEEFNLDTLEPGSRDPTCVRERVTFWMAGRLGLPFSHQRYIHLIVNGLQRGVIYADSQHIDGDYIESWFPDDAEGEIYKVDDWFEFTSDDFGGYNRADATLEDFRTSGGAKKQARYRWNWERKANQGLGDDYTPLFDLVDALNETNASRYTAAAEAVADADEWMRVFALRHVVCDWDGYGYQRGKNMFTYKPDRGRWRMLLWDLDFGLGVSMPATEDNLLQTTHEPVIRRMYTNAPFTRLYLNAVDEMVRTCLDPLAVDPVLDAHHHMLVENGVNAADVAGVKQWIALRRAHLLVRRIRNTYASPFAITSNGGSDFSTSTNLILLQGKAPVGVSDIAVNGIVHPVAWTTATNWTMSIVLGDGANPLSVVGLDRQGGAVDGASNTITVTFTGTNPLPQAGLVINEIMYHPATAGEEFVEIHNLSTNHAFDLYDYRLQGADLIFTQAVVVGPTGFVVVAENSALFAAKYGSSIPVAAEYAGALDNGGEALRLIQLNGTNADVLVDEVRYDDGAPWPAQADGAGPSLQLMDAAEDNDRVGNWAVGTNGTPWTPGAINSVTDDLPPFPEVWLNELQVTNTGGRDPWIELFNASNAVFGLTNFYLTDTYTNLVKWAFPTNAQAGSNGFLLVWADNQPGEATPTNFHANFRLATTSGCLALVHSNANRRIIVDYVNYGAIYSDTSYGRYEDGNRTNWQYFSYPSPGATNNAARPALVFINEWMADNDDFIVDPADGDDDEDWFELYNAGTSAVVLSGYRLTDNLGNPTKWTISNGVSIAAGGFLVVWADNEPNQNPNGIHANFALAKGGEALGLYTPAGVVVDSLTFGTQALNVSEGRWWDGQPAVYTMAIATPGTNNIVSTNNSSPVLDAIADRFAPEEAPLSFYVSATDTDQPPQRLRFSFDPGAPAGAALDAASGLFTWTPAEADGPGTNHVTVRVSDNGWTNLGDWETFAIVVEEVNKAPVVTPIADARTYPESLLMMWMSAADPDIPSNTLTFTLDPGAPPGADIRPADGLFMWTPTMAQAATTNPITVRVHDDGSPGADGTQAFSIAVGGADDLFEAQPQRPSGAGGAFLVTWSAESGLTYRVEFQSNAVASAWTVLSGDVTATGSVATKEDPTTSNAWQRFYRIWLLDLPAP